MNIIDMEKVYNMLDERELLDSKGNPARIDVIRRRIVLRANKEGLYNIEQVRKQVKKAFDNFCRKNKDCSILSPRNINAVRNAFDAATVEELFRIYPTSSLNMDRFFTFIDKVIHDNNS